MSSLTSFLKKDINLIKLLAFVGLIISAYLSFKNLGGSDLNFCITGKECDLVNNSIYSRIFGIPVSVIGLAGYILILIVSFYSFTKRKKWNLLYYFTVIGTSFSLYLTYVEVFKINAICSFCIASLIIILAIFIVLISKKTLMSPKSSFGKLVIVAIVFASIVIYGANSIQSSQDFIGDSNSYQIALAKHLGGIGARMYGSYKCPHCLDQKKDFGSAFNFIEYVECNNRGANANPSLCFAKGINVYPTWEIKGNYYQGQYKLSKLAELSGFESKEEFEISNDP
jgi:uncharacterized membrane protein